MVTKKLEGVPAARGYPMLRIACTCRDTDTTIRTRRSSSPSLSRSVPDSHWPTFPRPPLRQSWPILVAQASAFSIIISRSCSFIILEAPIGSPHLRSSVFAMVKKNRPRPSPSCSVASIIISSPPLECHLLGKIYGIDLFGKCSVQCEPIAEENRLGWAC